MSRFCAILEPHVSDVAIAQMGGELVYRDMHCGLGTLPDQRPAVTAGPYRCDNPAGTDLSAQLTAVGEVTLYNRTEVLRHLDGDQAACSDGELLLRLYAQRGVKAFTL
ncbi:MAG: hypothetical protein AAGF95_33690, partial [Chloroflexota bacterium]